MDESSRTRHEEPAEAGGRNEEDLTPDLPHDLEKLLEEIARGGKSAANALRRLLNLKDEAHYGFYNVGRKISNERCARPGL